MNADEKFARMIVLLNEKTNDKKIKWMHSDQWGTYADIGGRTILLDTGRNSNGEPLEVVRIVNGADTIDSANDESLPHALLPVGAESWFQLLGALRAKAYRQAIGADEAIDDILSALDDDVPF